eukprot:TRINITY_DN52252_c0_g1_i1.p1 TRINITY_DN52252_c0_g1~~TRINITY_DN52252_c0_g1_i1.p1  ORF type:complete len:591 (+),score=113.35 TRINITY_DN52252_c0_g1_i1:94-1866(+)
MLDSQIEASQEEAQDLSVARFIVHLVLRRAAFQGGDAQCEQSPDTSTQPKRELSPVDKVGDTAEDPWSLAIAPAIAGIVHQETLPKNSTVLACFDYAAQDDDELSFKQRDLMTIIEQDSEDLAWYLASLRGREGLIPANYVVEVSKLSELPSWFTQDLQEDLAQSPVTAKVSSEELVAESRLQNQDGQVEQLQPNLTTVRKSMHQAEEVHHCANVVVRAAVAKVADALEEESRRECLLPARKCVAAALRAATFKCASRARLISGWCRRAAFERAAALMPAVSGPLPGSQAEDGLSAAAERPALEPADFPSQPQGSISSDAAEESTRNTYSEISMDASLLSETASLLLQEDTSPERPSESPASQQTSLQTTKQGSSHSVHFADQSDAAAMVPSPPRGPCPKWKRPRERLLAERPWRPANRNFAQGLPPPMMPRPGYPVWPPPSRGAGAERDIFQGSGPTAPGGEGARQRSHRGLRRSVRKQSVDKRHKALELPSVQLARCQDQSVTHLYSTPLSKARSARSSRRVMGREASPVLGEDMGHDQASTPILPSILPSPEVEAGNERSLLLDSILHFAKTTDLPCGMVIHAGSLI